MVGHYVGYTGNAAIGVSWQIFLVVMVFISSLFSGMGVLVARFVGQGDHEKVNRTVYQAFLTSAALAVGILAPIGYFIAPTLLGFVNAAPEVQVQALSYLRIMFVFSFGMMTFFMLGGALRSAGDAKTPLRFGIALTVMNIIFNVILIRGLGPDPGHRNDRCGDRDGHSQAGSSARWRSIASSGAAGSCRSPGAAALGAGLRSSGRSSVSGCPPASRASR
ncbi:MAG: MATE family efflux transporter [Gemmatimonadales bacterium]